jgi:hypothetical protein
MSFIFSRSSVIEPCTPLQRISVSPYDTQRAPTLRLAHGCRIILRGTHIGFIMHYPRLIRRINEGSLNTVLHGHRNGFFMQHTLRFNLLIRTPGAYCTPPIPVPASTCYVHDVLPSDRRSRPCTLHRHNPTETGSSHRPPHRFTAPRRPSDGHIPEGLAVRFTESRLQIQHLNRATVNDVYTPFAADRGRTQVTDFHTACCPGRSRLACCMTPISVLAVLLKLNRSQTGTIRCKVPNPSRRAD